MGKSRENVLRFPRGQPSSKSIAAVVRWASRLSVHPRGTPAVLPLTWAVVEDTDGAILLAPVDGLEPGFAITHAAGEYDVLVCDPEDMDELGPFGTLDAALSGITHWLSLPVRMVEIGPGIAAFET